MPHRWRRVCILLVCLACGSTLHAQDEKEDLAELRARLDALERQNEELRQAVQERLTPASAEAPAAPQFRPTVFDAPSEDDARIRSIVDQYFAEQKAEEQAEEKRAAEEAAEAGYVVGSDTKLSATWNNGFEVSNKNKDFRFHVGGRYQFDSSWFGTSQNVQDNINLPYGDGVDFRRARLRVDGTMYETIEFACEYDFINSSRVRNSADNGSADFAVPAITDLWWTFTKLPLVGNFRVGNQKEAIGFEHIVSSRYLPFMERSYNQDTFYGGAFNGFIPGAQFINTYADEHGVWQLGVFKPTDNVFAFNNHSGDYSVVGRITHLPWYVDEGRGLLHVGASARQATTVNDRTRFRTRDAIRSGISVTWPIPADTGTLFAENMQWYNGELVGVYGPWTFQSEYLLSYLQNASTTLGGANVGTLFYHGGYAQLMYFLTGESDHYNRKTGIFERVTPHENAFLVSDDCGIIRGKGAWQVGARYDYLNLNDNGINGGILHNGTAGLNWFLNPSMKVQFNYTATVRDASLAGNLGDGVIHGFGMRFAQDF